MEYCQRCVYPANSAVPLTFDDQGVCSGCRVDEEKQNIDWQERRRRLKQILDEYKAKAQGPYHCIIPVSGGKDSHWQTHVIKREFGLNPLLVTFNHEMNTHRGIRNLTNLVKKFKLDHIRFTPNPDLIKRLSIYSLKKMGDMYWHSHCGIYTWPVQIAVKYKIPLIIWGEQGFMDLGGMFSHYDMVEMTNKVRVEHGLRGYDAQDMVSKKYGITLDDLSWAVYPTDEELDQVGVRGIYLGNFMPWDHVKQTELMIRLYDFETSPHERSFNWYENVEDFPSNGINDYLRYLKFGYGRATDHASYEIRRRRMTREQAIKLVKKYDQVYPSDIKIYSRYTGLSASQIIEAVDKMRDPRAWDKKLGRWRLKDPIWNHIGDTGVAEARLPLKGKTHYILNPKKFRPEPQEYTLM